MALIQKGYLGGQGPVFIDDTVAGSGKVAILQGRMTDGVMKLFAVQAAYATQLSGFPYTADQCSLGPYTDNQFVVNAPAYTQPPNAATNTTYSNVGTDWVSGNGAGTTNTTTTSTGTTASTGTTTSTGTTNTGTTSTGTSTGTGSGNTISTVTTQATDSVSDFLTKYWWAIALVAIVLLWKPVIAPALGLDKRRRR
jgi:hypothetical protein